MFTTSFSVLNKEEEIPEGVITFDQDDRFIDVNPIATKMLGFQQDQLLRRHFLSVFPTQTTHPLYQIYLQVKKSREHQRVTLYDEVHEKWFDTRVCPNKDGVTIYSRDISEQKIAERNGLLHETRYKTFFDHSMDGVILSYADGTIYAANPSACKIFGQSESEICDSGRLAILDETDPRLSPFLNKRKQEGEAESELTGIKKDGTKIPINVRSNVFFDVDGRECVSALIRDVSEIKNAKEKIQHQHYILNNLFQSFSSGVFSVDTNYCYTSYNQVHEEAMKLLYGKQIKIGESLLAYQTKEDAFQARINIDRALKGERFQIEAFSGSQEHTKIYVEITHNPIITEDGEVIGVSIESKDISSRKVAEDDLASSERKFRLLADNARDMIYRYELFPERKFTYVSPSVTKITGYTPEEHYADPDLASKIIHPEDISIFQETSEGRMRLVHDAVIRIIRKDGAIAWTEQNNTYFFDAEGRPIAFEGIGRDITERKLQEEALQKNEIFLRGILDSTDDGILAIDNKGKVVSANNRFIELWKIPQSLLEQKDDQLLLSFVLDQLAEPKSFLAKVEELYHSDSTDFDVIQFKDQRIFERYSTPLMLNGQITGRVWSFRDISNFKLTENALRQSESLYRSILKASPDNITIASLEGNIEMISPSALAIWGYQDESEILGRSILEFVLPEEEAKVLENIALMHQGINVSPIRFNGVRKDGSVFAIEVNADFMRNEAKLPSKLILAIRDISERKRWEDALFSSQQMTKEIINTIPVRVFWKNRELEYLGCNEMFAKDAGFSNPSEIIGKSDYELVWKSDAAL